MYFVSVTLDDEKGKQIYIPKGCAHGYFVLSEEAIVCYKCDALYSPHSEMGLRFNDPTINVPWAIEGNVPVLSEKDLQLPYFTELEKLLYD